MAGVFMRFIIVDGLDGAGKDTHARLIEKRYRRQGESVILRSHPEDDNPFGLKAKEALLKGGKINHIRASIYYTLDVVRSLWKYYKFHPRGTLIFSRYLIGVAYLPDPLAGILYRILSLILPTTDYMFFLDVSPEESLRRLEKRGKREMFENLEDLKKVRQRALKFAKDWHVINTEDSIPEVQERIDEILDELDRGRG